MLVPIQMVAKCLHFVMSYMKQNRKRKKDSPKSAEMEKYSLTLVRTSPISTEKVSRIIIEGDLRYSNTCTFSRVLHRQICKD